MRNVKPLAHISAVDLYELASDTQALAVVDAARDARLRVPEDLSVVGYDDFEAAAYQELTALRQFVFESGRRGVQ
jgi:LacI family transcriptional regulator